MANPILLGYTPTRVPAYISENAENPSVLITGISGCGKSSALQMLELQLADSDDLVVVLNFSATHSPENLNPYLREQFLGLANYIDVLNEGLPLSLWTPLSPSGQYLPLKTDIELIKELDANNALNVLSSLTHLGDRQKANLRDALLAAWPHRFEHENEMIPVSEAIAGLKEQYAEPISERLYTVLKLVAMKPKDVISPHRINIFDISSYDSGSQRMIADLVLSILWVSAVKYSATAKNRLFIVLDEFQGLNLGKDAPIPLLLKQARKFKTGLILATQTLAAFEKEQKAALSQPATKLYFKQTPAEAISVAKAVAGTSKKNYEKVLPCLTRGEFIASGCFKLGNNPAFTDPLQLRNILR